MRALITTPPAPPAIVDVEQPKPGPGEVLLRTIASALNPVDAQTVDGIYHDAGWAQEPSVGIGWDVTGEVIEVGDGVDTVGVGDVVAGLLGGIDKTIGTHAEQVVLPADAVAPLPESVDPVAAATVPVNAQTARQALALLGPERGSLLVTGAAGGVGGYALALAVDLGYDVTGLARETDRAFVESTGAAFTDRAEGTYDGVFDAAVLGDLSSVRDGGRYVGVKPADAPAPERGITVEAVMVTHAGDELASLLDLAAQGRLELRVASTITLDEVPEKLKRLSDGGQRGRIVVAY
ncbi:putative oxidoreductase [Gordonia araii NBRC 100433]|uniref:Putative oxidoreductase n=1 Tax=Gordonia araii NBRC 100433 TaxID=1073574 RepID=G7H3U8_9ACTN|nr:zinc-binding dehydrogenase [Gordonia araii]NNG97339.1 zinc-binding dehydrogenase [Gordonia araii NBRC 100433]GAB10523.1 putative oxidoreductase [Gordonia araii NBRC 100433]